MVRHAKESEVKEILNIYGDAKKFMAENGNPTQWPQNYPSEEIIKRDLNSGNLYIIEREGRIGGVMAFITGDDPTYKNIYGGTWLDDSPYGTIHRIAAAAGENGIFQEALSYCLSICSHLRIDTHEDNKIMRHVIEKNGFEERGMIYSSTGTPRIAYELLSRRSARLNPNQ